MPPGAATQSKPLPFVLPKSLLHIHNIFQDMQPKSITRIRQTNLRRFYCEEYHLDCLNLHTIN